MQNIYMSAKDVSEVMEVSLGHAYKLVKSMNKELEKQGYIIVAGKIPKKYLAEKIYGFAEVI